MSIFGDIMSALAAFPAGDVQSLNSTLNPLHTLAFLFHTVANCIN